jgi:hypothetical protein
MKQIFVIIILAIYNIGILLFTVHMVNKYDSYWWLFLIALGGWTDFKNTIINYYGDDYETR